MNEFTASNGVRVCTGSLGLVVTDGTIPNTVIASNGHETALREFFRAEEDERLGRWRVPGHPSWVCYPTPLACEVVVFNEDEPQYGTQVLSRGTDTWPYYRSAADAYFAAHPEPKPWHDAKPGEVWVLTFSDEGGGGTEAWTLRFSSLRFEHPDYVNSVARTDSTIVSGRRIYPEVSS